MAEHEQRPEFLGGGQKFNAVGRDTRGPEAAEEPIVPVNQTGYWLRIAGIIVVVVLLAGALFFLNENNMGRTTVQPAHGGRAVDPDAAKPTTDPSLK